MGKRNKMPVSERAKQFSPFAAVTGLEKALEKEEIEHEKKEKIEFSEDSAEKLNRSLVSLKKGDRVVVKFYQNGEYFTVSGSVTLFDPIARVLKVGETEIRFEDLYKIKKDGLNVF